MKTASDEASPDALAIALAGVHAQPLWDRYQRVTRRAPAAPDAPMAWPWAVMEPLIGRAIREVGMEEAERRVLLLTLPALAIAKGLTAVLFRMTRSSVLDVVAQDHVRTARAKGLHPGRVVLRHVLRNALSPVLTVLGLHMGALLGGTVLVEYVFNWPGLSTPLLRAVESRDYPMVVGIVLVVSTLFLTINLVVDLLRAALDPRIRTS